MIIFFSRCWRLTGTALSFLAFGLGGLAIPLLIVPLIQLTSRSQQQREIRSQRVIHLAFRFYIRFMRALGVLSYQLEDLERLKNAKLVLANHPSLIDVVFLLAVIPNANCVVKGKLLANPFTRGPVTAAGYLLNDGNSDILESAKQVFDKGQALIIFPEGTRTTPGAPLRLQRGAANLAIRSAVDITPIIIHCNPTTLTKGEPWYHIPSRRVQVNIRAMPTIPIEPYCQGPAPRAARSLTRDLTDYFNEEIKRYV